MDDDAHALLTAGGAICLLVLAASLLCCGGLADIINRPSCFALQGFTLRIVDTVRGLLGYSHL